jgi:signal transduction histidine kinase
MISVRLRLALWFTLLILLLMVISEGISWLTMRQTLYNLASEKAHDKAREIQELVQVLAEGNPHFRLSTAGVLNYTLAEEQNALYREGYIQITSLEGKILERSLNLAGSLPLLPLERIGPLTLSPDGRSVRTVYYSTALYQREHILGYLQIAISMAPVHQVLQQQLVSRLLALAVISGFVVLLGWLLARQSLRPVLQVARRVKDMEDHELFNAIPTQGMPRDEILELTDTFNGLLKRIERAFELQQRFISDASHELRSPLTSIGGHAQLLLKRGLNDPVMLQRGLGIITRETERLERLVNDFLLLARLEKRKFRPERINLSQYIEQLVQEQQIIYPQISFSVADSRMYVQVEPDMLKRAVLNVLDNALRALRTHGSRVRIHCERGQDNALIVIEDDGPGIPAEHQPFLFDRFYRIEDSRDRRKGGSGLGLPIVREIVQAHGGQFRLASEEGKGTTCTIELPLA